MMNPSSPSSSPSAPAAPPSSGLRDGVLKLALGRLSPAGAAARLSILIFHRVVAEPDPLFPGEVDRRGFDEICRWLAAWGQVLPLDRAVELLAEGRLPPRALVITFDDGYADNHDVAVPVLRAHGLPASFFISTGYLDGGRMWNDTAIEALRRCRQDRLDIGDLGLPGVERVDLSSIEARQQAVRQVLGAAKYLAPPERQAFVDRLAQRAGAALPGDLMMSSAQVRAMAAAGMQIGAHTVTHPILAKVGEDEARQEMLRSKQTLEALLDHEVSLFAYPNGRPGQDYQARDAALVRQCGFRAAVSTAPGAARSGDDVFQLPRFTPWDRRGGMFGLRLLRNLFTPTVTV